MFRPLQAKCSTVDKWMSVHADSATLPIITNKRNTLRKRSLQPTGSSMSTRRAWPPFNFTFPLHPEKGYTLRRSYALLIWHQERTSEVVARLGTTRIIQTLGMCLIIRRLGTSLPLFPVVQLLEGRPSPHFPPVRTVSQLLSMVMTLLHRFRGGSPMFRPHSLHYPQLRYGLAFQGAVA